MKILLIGGTGTISTAISRLLLGQGHELYLLNRGTRAGILQGAHLLTADASDEEAVGGLTAGMQFDAVADFVAFAPSQVQRDFRLFRGRTRQYFFISSASAYRKPLADYRITESTPLANPYWEYSRNKIACEEFLTQQFRESGFPVTIVRPSHTYDERSVPLGVHGKKGSWQVVRRMLQGKPVIIQGDGTSLWTMTHSSDFARGFAGLIGNIHAVGEAVQITSDETLTWNQIYECIAAALHVKLSAVHISSEFLAACDPESYLGTLIGDKSNSVVFDNSKLRRLVPGFHAQVRFDQGIARTVENILAHPDLQTADPAFDTWCDRIVAARETALGALCGH